MVNLGLVPTPVLYYGTEVLETQTGIMLTGSHNPSQHNGLKIVMNGETLHGDRIQAFKQRIHNKAFSEGSGHEEERDISDRYLNDIANDIVLARPLKIAIDCGNGVTGELAPRLFTQLGCDVTPLYTEISRTPRGSREGAKGAFITLRRCLTSLSGSRISRFMPARKSSFKIVVGMEAILNSLRVPFPQMRFNQPAFCKLRQSRGRIVVASGVSTARQAGRQFVAACKAHLDQSWVK